MPLYVKRLPVDLPQTSLAGAPTPVNALPVAIQKDLTVSVRGVPVDAEWSAVTLDSSTTVELSVDKEVTYDVIAKTLARLQEKHPKEIILITR
jgi:biopolymer transport protein ExbD